jgi:glucose dehydrogenase
MHFWLVFAVAEKNFMHCGLVFCCGGEELHALWVGVLLWRRRTSALWVGVLLWRRRTSALWVGVLLWRCLLSESLHTMG